MKLYPYQEEGVRFLAERERAYLADGMGLGKTIQALTAAEEVGAEDTLVVAPASAIPNWVRQAEGLWMDQIPTTVSYASLSRSASFASEIRDLSWPLVILDEAHYCKNPEAKRTKAALSIAAAADRAWLLSGTPMPNDPRELYPPFRYLWPERLPEVDGRPATAFQWMDRYTQWFPVRVGYGQSRVKVTGVVNGKELRAKLFGDDPIMLRRKLEDVGIELPPLRVHVHYLPEDHAFNEALEKFEPGTSETRRLLGGVKAGPIASTVVDEMATGAYSRIVIMYHHHDTGKALRDKLDSSGIAVFGFDGSTPSPTRVHEIEQFQTYPYGAAAFVVQQQAGGTGTDGLQVANEIILAEPDWSPAENAQAIKRVHRIGTDSPVRARLFAVEGSLDAAIMETLAAKIEMRKEVIG